MMLLGTVTVLGSEWIHFVILFLVIALAVFSLPASYHKHGSWQPIAFALTGLLILSASFLIPESLEWLLTVPGSILMIWAHLLNKWLLMQQTPVMVRA
jgi:cytosine/uracil/thiamine/allantoin permease